MRIIDANFLDYLDYLGRQDINTQIENDIRIITTRSKKKRKKEVIIPDPQKTMDSYEQAMDTSKYDQILSDLTI